MKTVEEMEAFMLKHGENVIDTLGSEVDRIERNLKASYCMRTAGHHIQEPYIKIKTSIESN